MKVEIYEKKYARCVQSASCYHHMVNQNFVSATKSGPTQDNHGDKNTLLSDV